MPLDISILLNGHREGVLIEATCRSLAAAADNARASGLSVEMILVLDRADDKTREFARRNAHLFSSLIECEFGNLGAARRLGLSHCRAEWVAFCDGDDLVSSNWLVAAHSYGQASDGKPTVFHTEQFIGFGGEVFFRQALRTSDPEFDPFCLAVDWFYCNNLFCRRALIEQHPIEPYDHDRGLGAEDWHWSCKTTALGIARDFIPETTYFYRVKPPELSLGMTQGLVHGASALFSAESARAYVADFHNHRSLRERFSGTPRSPRLFRPPPQWILEQAREQMAFDSDLAEVARRIARDRDNLSTFPPRMHYGAAQTYAFAAAELDDRPKTALFVGETEWGRDGHLFDRMIEGAASRHENQQLMVFSESKSLSTAALEKVVKAYGGVLVDLSSRPTLEGAPDRYISLLILRFLIQFDVRVALDVGSIHFARTLGEFRRATRSHLGEIIHLTPFLIMDRQNPLCIDWLKHVPQVADVIDKIIVLDPAMARYVRAAGRGSPKVRLDSRMAGALRQAMFHQWRTDRAEWTRAREHIRFDKLGRSWDRGASGPPLAREWCPKWDKGVLVIPVSNSSRDYRAILGGLAAGSEVLPWDQIVLLGDGPAGDFQLNEDVRVRSLATDAADLCPALANLIARCFSRLTIMETGAWPTTESELSFRAQDLEAPALVPECVVHKTVNGWQVRHWREDTLNAHNGMSLWLGACAPLGSVSINPNAAGAVATSLINGPDFTVESAATAVAVAAARLGRLGLAPQTLTVIGTAWNRSDPRSWSPFAVPVENAARFDAESSRDRSSSELSDV